ncbi:AMP-dependent synthetase [Paractinoplanes deccanensis]|uniref:AMP-dependent synthetase n=1 Tax=Paractinoplanes deccanensis TaxID=113561 RepID=A0ABQ3Y3X5_9ACTN|nr:fatty acid--CoA ligase family protein [Actinoplanes deccanensis]GID74673.1 AMP-dependent synthetase [Actinoplanes deccanensis]
MWPEPVLGILSAAGDRVVFEDGAREVTGSAMLSMIRRIAAGLRGEGVGPGDGVILLLGVDAPAFAAIIAAFAVGARVSGVRADQLDHVAAAGVGTLIDDARVAALLHTPDEPLSAAGRPGDIARILYTSGSTGEPKGCCQTYEAMTAAWAAHPDRWPPAIRALAERMDRFLVFGSLTSQVMLEYGILALAAGGRLVVARQPAFPDAIVRHRATASVITVGKLHQLVRSLSARPPTLRALMVSGSPLDPGRLREALEALGPVVFHGYGQTETGMIAMLTPGEMLESPSSLASVGRPPAAVEVDVRDGELYVRTPAQAASYWNDPTLTAEVFVDGWVRTRDLAHLDPNGYLHLTGRARDVIIVHAELIHAGAVERALATDPAVAEAYVIGKPDPSSGEAVHAFVVAATGRTPDTTALAASVAARLGEKATPATITVIDQVPTTPAGKPDKASLAHLAPTSGSGDRARVGA